MTLLRSPIRSTTRSPLRGPLEDAFGESSPLSITAPASYSYLTSASPYDIGSTLQVADSEDVGGTYTVAITLTSTGTLTLSGTVGLTGSGSGTSSLSYSGTLSAWNTALNGADIAGLTDETATMSITLTRDADSEEISRNVTVNAYPALAIASLDPADNATGVAYNQATFTATFARAIQAGTGNVILKLVGGAAIETFDIATGLGDQGGTVVISGADLIVTPGVNLTDASAHAIQIAATAIDGAAIGTGDSFAGIADDTTWSFTAEDTTPTLSSPLDSATGGTTGTAAVSTDRGDGTLYWVVTTSATTPSHAQIKAGQDHTGAAAADDGSQAVTATGSQPAITITGLTSETTYYTHFTQESANLAAATPVSADGFTTDDVTAPTISSSVPADNATGVAVDSTIAITFDETVVFSYPGGGNVYLRSSDGAFSVVETFTPSSTTAATGSNGGSIAIVGAVMTITPGADMAETTPHAIRIDTNCVEDSAGNAFAGITDDTTLNFTTGVADAYAIGGTSPDTVADFNGTLNSGTPYFRVGGVDSDFETMFAGYTDRSDLATMFDSDGLLKWCPHNLLAYSENAGNAAWSKSNLTVSGSAGAETFTASAGSNIAARTWKTVTTSVNEKYEYEFRVAAGTAGFVSCCIYASAAIAISVLVNLTTGAVVETRESAGHWSGTTTSVEDHGSGVYTLLVSTASTSSAPTLVGINILTSSAQHVSFNFASNVFSPAGTETIEFYGAGVRRASLGGVVDCPVDQRTSGAAASYVPTTTAARYLKRRGNHVYNGTSWVDEGIKIESEARTNFATYSSAFSSWTNTNTTDVSGQTNALTGASDATLLYPNSTGTLRWIYLAKTGSSRIETWSIYAKAQNLSVIYHDTGTGTASTFFDLSAGTVGTTASGYTGRIVDCGNGWYRCIVTSNSAVTNSFAGVWGVADADGSTTVTANGTDGVYIFHAQNEEGSTPSLPIPTSGSTVTRAADDLQIPAANMAASTSAMSIHTKGTVTYADENVIVNARIVYWVADASNLITHDLYTSGAYTGSLYFRQVTAGVADFPTIPNPGAYSEGVDVSFNIAARHTSGAINGAVNGSALTENSTPTALCDLSSTNLVLGENSGSSGFSLNLALFRQWDSDIGDTGIESASA